mgnify:CR=1 FL=1
MMLNEIRNKVLGGEKITVEEACWLSCKAEKQDLYDAAHEITGLGFPEIRYVFHHQC